MLKSAKSSPNSDVQIKGKKAVLTPEEKNGILFMREVEKLALDLYTQFYGLYNNKIFLNISESEQRHCDAMLNLINYYGLTDPSAGKGVSEFVNTEVQSFYNTLLASGQHTLLLALEAGVSVETEHIADLTELMAQTSVRNIVQVYMHLLNGSENHLKSFEKALDKL